jgi:4'-phosphopantetheinyl transferase
MTHLALLHLRCTITTTLANTDTAREATLLDAQETKT